jgi:leader peptidase (prepilin peptidase) / N-methyltransferase
MGLVLADVPQAVLLVPAAVLGFLFGSFNNVVIHRLPRGESVVFPASHCPQCGKPIAAYDNLPVLSYLLLRGRARCCRVRIPARYPVVELLGGLWALAVMRGVLFDLPGRTPLWQVGVLFCCYLALGLMLLAALFIDLDHMILPDALTLGAAAVGLASVPLRPIGWIESVLGGLAGYLGVRLLFVELYGRLRGHPGMGLGDAKLLLVAGVWFGWKGALFALLGGSVLGTVTALLVLLIRGKLEEPESVQRERQELQALVQTLEGDARTELEQELERDPLMQDAPEGLGGARLAFGPFLVLATLAYLFVGPLILQIYGFDGLP